MISISTFNISPKFRLLEVIPQHTDNLFISPLEGVEGVIFPHNGLVTWHLAGCSVPGSRAPNRQCPSGHQPGQCGQRCTHA